MSLTFWPEMHKYKKFAIALDVDRRFVKGLSGDDNVEKLDEIIGK